MVPMISSLLAADVLSVSHFMISHGWMLQTSYGSGYCCNLLNILPQNHGCNVLHMVARVFTNRPWFWQGAKVGPRDRHHLQVLLFDLLLWTKRAGFRNLHINTEHSHMDVGFRRVGGYNILNTLADDRISCVSISSRIVNWPVRSDL